MPPSKPDDLVLHRCFGQVRRVLEGDKRDRACCATCQSPIVPEQRYHRGHAGMACEFCGEMIGFCGAEVLTDVLDEAEMIVRSA